MLHPPQMVKRQYKSVKAWNEFQILKLNLFDLVRRKAKNFIKDKIDTYLLKLSLSTLFSSLLFLNSRITSTSSFHFVHLSFQSLILFHFLIFYTAIEMFSLMRYHDLSSVFKIKSSSNSNFTRYVTPSFVFFLCERMCFDFSGRLM